MENILFCYLKSLFLYLLFKKIIKAMEQIMIPVHEQVVTALDGRTQRWLALQIAVPESDMSKKMNGKMDFTDEEIKAINSLLRAKIKK